MVRTLKLVTDSVARNKSSKNDPARTGISPARFAAYQILRRVENEGAYASVLLAAQDHLSDRDRALTYELTMGVLRWQLLLDRLIEHYAQRPPERLDNAVCLILRLA